MKPDLELGSFQAEGVEYALAANRSVLFGWELVAIHCEHGIKRFRTAFVQSVIPSNLPMTEAKQRLLSLLAGISQPDEAKWELVSDAVSQQTYRECKSGRIARILSGGRLSFSA